jgi:hypothetical protein
MTESDLKALLLLSYRSYHGKDEQSVRQALFSMFRAMSTGLFDDLPDGVNPGEDAERTRVQQKLRYDQFALTRDVSEAIIDEVTEGAFINLIRKVSGLDATTVTCTMSVNVGNVTISAENVDGIATPTSWVQQSYAAKSVVTHTVDNKLQTWFAVRATSTVPGSAPTPAQEEAGKSADWVSHEVKALPRTVRFKLVGTPALNDQIQLTISNQTYTYTYAASDTSVNDLAAGVVALAAADALFQVTNPTDALKSLSAAFASGVWQTSLAVMGILLWSNAQVYVINSVVRHNGQLWTNTAQTLAGEEPGVSNKWTLTSYGVAGGDLTGNYPNPTLVSVTSAATKGTADKTPTITVDVKGRVTSLTDQSIAITPSQAGLGNVDNVQQIPKSLATQADQSIYSTAANTWAAFSFTSQWRSFVSTLKAAWNETTGVLSTWGLQINTAPTTTPTGAPGLIVWNDQTGTLEFQVKGGSVTLEIGQEQILRVKNDEGSALTVGTVVYLSGADGTHVLVKKASATNDALSAYTIGIVVEAMNNNGQGWIAISGYVRNLNTNHLTEGAPVWLSATLGLTTATKPVAPAHSVFIGMCVRRNANVGSILLSVQNGYEIDELHDVLISSVSAGDVLIRNSGNTVWENKAQSSLALSSSQVGVYATSTTNGSAGSSTNLTIGSLSSGSARFVRLTIKAKSASGDFYGRTLDAMWKNTAGTLLQVGSDSLGTAKSAGSLAGATIVTSASGTSLRVICTDVTGCGVTVTWEVFGEYY